MHDYMHKLAHAIHLARIQTASQPKKARVDFADAEQVFTGTAFTFEDNREDYGEQRWVTLGLLGEQVMVIVPTETEDEIHVISTRKADKEMWGGSTDLGNHRGKIS